MANTFSYTYKPVDYATAQKQVAGQVDPLFQRAIQGVQQQKYASDVQAGQVAASRGLGHSGLAADQLNKIAIAAQGQVGDLNAQRATQIAQLANAEVWNDKNYSLQNRSQLYNEWNNNRDYQYQQGRDKVSDGQWNQQFTYQQGRDKVSDSQWNKNYNHQVSQDALAQQWKNKEWNQMSPAEKAQMALQYSYSKKGSGGGGRGGSSRGSSSKTTSTKPSAVPKNIQDQYNAYIKWFTPQKQKQNVTFSPNGISRQAGY